MHNSVRHIVRELVTALSVLALVFLSFGHQPSTANFDDVAVKSYQVSILSFCGDGPENGNHSGHGPCHACRSSIGILPPPPCDAEPAFINLAKIDFHRKDDTTPISVLSAGYNSRAPPVSI